MTRLTVPSELRSPARSPPLSGFHRWLVVVACVMGGSALLSRRSGFWNGARPDRECSTGLSKERIWWSDVPALAAGPLVGEVCCPERSVCCRVQQIQASRWSCAG
jgi:hypothetical protein